LTAHDAALREQVARVPDATLAELVAWAASEPARAGIYGKGTACTTIGIALAA
jgi:hypothetical protein